MSIFHDRKKQHICSYVLFFIVFIGITIFANGVFAIANGGVGGRPAYPRSDNSRTESIFIHTLELGAIQKEGILLLNNTDEQKTLLVYTVDSMVSSGGAFACRQMAEPKEDVGAWISLEKSEVTLDSMTSEIVPFNITVPLKADVGEHNGCIVIQEKEEHKEKQVGMTLSFRTGLRVAITIPGEIIKELKIIDLKIERQKDGDYLLKPSIKNVGNVSIDADIQIITRHFLGLESFQHGGQFPILRNEISDWNFELKETFWGGWYQSSFVAEYEGGAETEIGEITKKPKTQLKGPSVWFFVTPKPLAMAIEVGSFLFIVLLGFFFWLSRKRKNWIKKDWINYEIKSNEDIKILAERFNVSWKLLAKANKLQPPYTLKFGENIKVPPIK